jgi:hypothetical protein
VGACLQAIRLQSTPPCIANGLAAARQAQSSWRLQFQQSEPKATSLMFPIDHTIQFWKLICSHLEYFDA